MKPRPSESGGDTLTASSGLVMRPWRRQEVTVLLTKSEGGLGGVRYDVRRWVVGVALLALVLGVLARSRPRERPGGDSRGSRTG